MLKNNPLKLNIHLIIDPLIVDAGWFADIYVICEFHSARTGVEHKISAPLNSNAAKKITDSLLKTQSANNVTATKREQKLVCKYVADAIGGIVARQPEWYRKRGYPLRCTKY